MAMTFRRFYIIVTASLSPILSELYIHIKGFTQIILHIRKHCMQKRKCSEISLTCLSDYYIYYSRTHCKLRLAAASPSDVCMWLYTIYHELLANVMWLDQCRQYPRDRPKNFMCIGVFV